MAYSDEDREYLDKITQISDHPNATNATATEDTSANVPMELAYVAVAVLGLVAICLAWRYCKCREKLSRGRRNSDREAPALINVNKLTHSGPKKSSGEPVTPPESELMINVEQETSGQDTSPSGGSGSGACGGGGGAGRGDGERKSAQPGSRSRKGPVRKRGAVPDLEIVGMDESSL